VCSAQVVASPAATAKGPTPAQGATGNEGEATPQTKIRKSAVLSRCQRSSTERGTACKKELWCRLPDLQACWKRLRESRRPRAPHRSRWPHRRRLGLRPYGCAAPQQRCEPVDCAQARAYITKAGKGRDGQASEKSLITRTRQHPHDIKIVPVANRVTRARRKAAKTASRKSASRRKAGAMAASSARAKTGLSAGTAPTS